MSPQSAPKHDVRFFLHPVYTCSGLYLYTLIYTLQNTTMTLTDVRYKILRSLLRLNMYMYTLQNAIINCKINTFIGLLRLGKQEVVF